MKKLYALLRALSVAVAAGIFLANPVLVNAAGLQAGDRDRTHDQITDQLQVRDRIHTDTLIEMVLEGDQDQDQLRLRDGSCGSGCDGEPDQDRDRLQLGK
ncbi:MAG: hypothetical protein PVG66_10675 [Chromatiales bacterium]